MDRAEIFAFLNANHDCHLATVEGNKPHVRAIGIYRADEDGIIIQTTKVKDLYKQLSANPDVELCFNDAKGSLQIRVSGTLELDEDIELKKKILAKRHFLKPIVDKKGYEVLAIYRLKKGLAAVWTFRTNFEPKTYIRL
jgi:pyridoxamine 5'-phosphate oxidase